MTNFNHLNNLLIVIEFSNLHVTENLKAIIKALTGIAGIYAIINNNVTGKIYIGSSLFV